MHWMKLFMLWCLGLLAAGLAAIWLLGGFADLGLDATGVTAFAVGIVLTVATGVALMGLMFYSGRSGRDADLHQGRER